MKSRQIVYLVLALLFMPLRALAQDKLTIDYLDKPAVEAFADLAQKANQTVLIESPVKGKVSISATNFTFEEALTGICKSLDIVWRKLFIEQAEGEKLNADKLAAVVRIISAANLPDVLIADPKAEKPMIFSRRTNFVIDLDAIAKETGLKLVYLVSNDRAAAQKTEYSKSSESKEKSKAEKYADKQAELINDFLEMTPEERAEAMRKSMQMVMAMDPRIMQEIMRTSMESLDPQLIGEVMRLNTEMMMSMPGDKLAEMIRIQMEAMRNLPPDVMQKIVEATQTASQPKQ